MRDEFLKLSMKLSGHLMKKAFRAFLEWLIIRHCSLCYKEVVLDIIDLKSDKLNWLRWKELIKNDEINSGNELNVDIHKVTDAIRHGDDNLHCSSSLVICFNSIPHYIIKFSPNDDFDDDSKWEKDFEHHCWILIYFTRFKIRKKLRVRM